MFKINYMKQQREELSKLISYERTLHKKYPELFDMFLTFNEGHIGKDEYLSGLPKKESIDKMSELELENEIILAQLILDEAMTALGKFKTLQLKGVNDNEKC
jgi:hypothetical protein